MHQTFYFVCACFALTACQYDDSEVSSDTTGSNTTPEYSQSNVIDDLPPDPGLEGKLTLEGIDSDNDGVRDDIQRYIAQQEYPSQEFEKAVTAVARSMQYEIVNSFDRNKIVSQVKVQPTPVACLVFYDIGNRAFVDLQRLKAQVFNTEERIRAKLRSDSYLGGMTISLPSLEVRQKYCSELTAESTFTY
ncbi:hypothetical protein [Vibrio sonorensis]|uniref:hypothetical protein n=1 Tax=Vibrio sonorensis TaxID=1004316 RepID=UPI0008DAF16E|nr:hypothetical protein [Vibrio sonorensis]